MLVLGGVDFIGFLENLVNCGKLAFQPLLAMDSFPGCGGRDLSSVSCHDVEIYQARCHAHANAVFEKMRQLSGIVLAEPRYRVVVRPKPATKPDEPHVEVQQIFDSTAASDAFRIGIRQNLNHLLGRIRWAAFQRALRLDR